MEGRQENEPALESEPPGTPFEAIIEALGSRRLLLGTMFGAMAGSAPFLMAQHAAAAPADVKGSPNVPLRVFVNTKGSFILWSDGHITNAKSGTNVTAVDSTYPPAAGYTPAARTPNRPVGSPRVAVDVVQDENGTYVLYADGSIRQPPVAGAGAPGYPILEYFTAGTLGGNGGMFFRFPSDNLIVSGASVTFKTPFKEPPMYWTFWNTGTCWKIYTNGHPDDNSPTATGYDTSRWNYGGRAGGFFGIGTH